MSQPCEIEFPPSFTFLNGKKDAFNCNCFCTNKITIWSKWLKKYRQKSRLGNIHFLIDLFLPIILMLVLLFYFLWETEVTLYGPMVTLYYMSAVIDFQKAFTSICLSFCEVLPWVLSWVIHHQYFFCGCVSLIKSLPGKTVCLRLMWILWLLWLRMTVWHNK